MEGCINEILHTCLIKALPFEIFSISDIIENWRTAPTFAFYWFPSEFICDFLIKLHTEGLKTRVESSVLQYNVKLVKVCCQIIPYRVICLVCELFSNFKEFRSGGKTSFCLNYKEERKQD